MARNHNKAPQSFEDRAARVIKAGLVIGVAAVGVVVAPKTAEAQMQAPVERSQKQIAHEQAIKSAEHGIEQRIQLNMPVRHNANFDYAWSPKGVKGFKYKTADPIVRKVEGKDRFFELVQTGDSLTTVQARILPLNGTRVQGSATFMQEANGGHIADGVQVTGSPTEDNRIETTSGVLSLNTEWLPETPVMYENGGSAVVNPGVTQEINAKVLLG